MSDHDHHDDERDDEPEFWDDHDYYDDHFSPQQDEPCCYDCLDSGIDGRGRRCRTCLPTRFEFWRWQVREWFRTRWPGRRTTADDPWHDSSPF